MTKALARISTGLAAGFGLFAAFLNPAAAADGKLKLIATFNTPVYVTEAPGDSSLLFVVEQTGRIFLLKNEIKQAQPFLDVSSLISCCDERGLLSVAFPPNYQTSKRFYIAFTNPDGDVEVDEFQRSSNPLFANASTRRQIIVVPHRDAGNHNGGQLQFGGDGTLYISIGDGGALSPPGYPAPDKSMLLGKILRIDPRQNGAQPYTIPPSNPFVGSGDREEIYAYGLRNPWRFSIDSGNIIIADVGQSQWEEINYLPLSAARGTNFGWPQYEGNHNFNNSLPGEDPPKFPMLVYDHNGGRCAVIGGYVSKDPAVPSLQGRYLYGDLCEGQIRSFVADVSSQRATKQRPAGIVAANITSFGRGNNHIYVTQTSGQLSRIVAP
jgi:glucose/arabinose dehydrogenase